MNSYAALRNSSIGKRKKEEQRSACNQVDVFARVFIKTHIAEVRFIEALRKVFSRMTIGPWFLTFFYSWQFASKLVFPKPVSVPKSSACSFLTNFPLALLNLLFLLVFSSSSFLLNQPWAAALSNFALQQRAPVTATVTTLERERTSIVYEAENFLGGLLPAEKNLEPRC